MDLTHRFTVPTSVDETWEHFQDIASVAECFPGATVTSDEGDTFAGSVKVKLGPIALVYNGSGTFVEKDEAAHRFLVDAKGKDKRGNGTAGAKVTLTMTEAAAGATDVVVVTDLNITGKPAQFGRGVMQDVSDKLLGQFVACLEQRPQGPQAGAAAAAPAPADTADAGAADAAAPLSGGETAPEPVPPPPPPAAPDVTGSAPPPPPPPPAAAAGGGAAAPLRRVTDAPRHATEDDALNLGATVLPILVKSYGRQVAAGLGVLAILWWLLSRARARR